ncbi:tail fiber protein [Synechococcus phage ACG-2014e]|uniref:Tail fiber-like protein n=1 Tax=Synechococcus phage ACG-2014e TaxID=1493510 RepID=A0A0E3G6D2_9CAUD|nr:tail fiber protein [Synechococcus phage ACG-2014e]YP_010355786.1 tail fiber protein [Synechococcus phage ACG-2014e]AIX20637.1 tail fiber-like protein [Synechococcus phage ACG-2014e]AIX29852.1 tail fiber-like protein [Synechococcus phage ACG-2014e]AIX45090.1 tail fiber-like protein [Synechococcus phage ACG-2014e]
MSKILANQIANYGDNSPVEVKEGVNIPAGKPLQAAGNAGTSGQVLTATPTSIEWATPFDGSYLSLTNTPTIPASQVNADWNASGGSVAAILNKPVVPAQPSVSVINAVGSGNLTYNQANGEFTFTPPDLSGLAANTNVSNWNAAYDWGDHAQAGYAAVANAANWDVAYGWGDHGVAGYLTAESDTLQSVMARGATTSVQIIANAGVRADILGVGGGVGNGDVQLQHNDVSNVSTLQHLNVNGSLEIKSVSGINLKPGSASGNSVDIYHNIDGSTELLRIQTTDTGVDISGNLSVSGTVSGVDIEDLDNVNIAGGLQDQQVLKWEASSSSWKPANDLVGGASGIQFNDLSVVENAVGTAALSYNNTNGVFTYTPPDLTPYLTTETDPVFSAHVSSGILQTNLNQWTAAYGWGDHSTAGYLTSYSETGTLADVTGRGATTSSNLTLGGTVQFNNNSAFANDKVLNFGASSNGRILYVSATNSFDVRVPGGAEDLKLGAGTAVRITNENGLTDRAVFTASGLTVTGNLLYSNNYATTGDLPNATTYHGMFAHVHAEGHGYFAHAGAWTQLLDTGSSLGELADVATTAPSVSDVLTWDGSNWGPAAPTGGGGGANVTISDTAPGSASAGDLWWESDKGRLKIYYNDTDSTQWVDASPPLTNANVPVYVGEVELYQGGNQITWLGSGGITAAIRATEGGGGFQSPCIRVTFAQAFSASDAYTIQATVYNPSTIGHVYQTSIRKTGPQYFDFQVYNLTSSAVATDFKVAITIYAI